MIWALPLSETVTAGARVRRQRDTSMARRLGFDLLQRQLRGVRRVPANPIPAQRLAGQTLRRLLPHLADSRSYPQSARRIGRHWKPPVGSAWPRCATWSCCVGCSDARWSYGWCWIGHCSCRNRATAFASAPSAKPPLTPRNFLLLAERA